VVTKISAIAETLFVFKERLILLQNMECGGGGGFLNHLMVWHQEV